MNKAKTYTSEELSKFLEENKNKIPIYKGCRNKQCYCTGACKEVIGYRDKLPGEESPYDYGSFPPFNTPEDDSYREAYEKNLKRIQDEHLERVRKNNNQETIGNQGFKVTWSPCMHDNCTQCHGTGLKFDGSACVHFISCQCPKCTPVYTI